MRRSIKRELAEFVCLSALVVLLGCQGNTDGGSAAKPDFREGVFVGDSTSTGSISIQLSRSQFAVGDTTSFKVSVSDSKGQPVQSAQVVCDTEKGVALIEPTSGHEMTDSSGEMNGQIGCAAPGDFQMVCRLSIGANRRQFVKVSCTGEIPSGFTGFPGTGGGGLGGGSQGGSDGAIRITAAGFVDNGSFGSSTVPVDASIDINQASSCDTDATTVDPEPFFDTYAMLQVENNMEERVALLYVTCSLVGIDGTSREVSCGTISLTRAAEVVLQGNGATTIVQVPIFKAFQGIKWVGKSDNNPGTGITQTGLFSVTFKIYYRNLSEDGQSEVPLSQLPYITARTTAAMGNYNRC